MGDKGKKDRDKSQKQNTKKKNDKVKKAKKKQEKNQKDSPLEQKKNDIKNLIPVVCRHLIWVQEMDRFYEVNGICNNADRCRALTTIIILKKLGRKEVGW